MDPSALFSIYLGLAAHSTNLDDQAFQDFSNPVGTVEVQAQFTPRIHGYVRHESSIPRRDRGYNTVGIQLRIW